MYSVYKLNKQGDNIQPWHTPFPIWNQSVVPCPDLTVASWPAYRFLKSQVKWSGIPISFRIFHRRFNYEILIFWIMAMLISIVALTIYAPPWFSLFHILIIINICWSFIIAILTGMRLYLSVFLIYIFLMISDKHFSCTLWSLKVFFGEMVILHY